VTHDVLIAGAGPVGLMLATELRLAGVHVLVVERRTTLDTAAKAEGVNAACAAVFERRGMLPALQAIHRPFTNDAAKPDAAQPRFAGHFAGIQVRADLVDGDGWGMLQVPQVEIERILGERAADLGVEVRRGVEVQDVHIGDDVVTVGLSDGSSVCGSWLVGCDGGRSTVRRLAGFDFVGTDPEITGIQAVATVEGADLLGRGWQYGVRGLYVYGPMPGRVRTFEFNRPLEDRTAAVTADEVEAALRRISGADVRVTDVQTAARVSDNARQATTYRRGRILLCGDAAHVHPPFSGQGLNLGIGDAANLGWKLAATVSGRAAPGLLDTYVAERHPIGAQVLDWTRAQVAVMRGDEASSAMRDIVADLLGTRDGATYYVQRASGLGQRYEFGGGNPAVGAITTTYADHMHGGRFLLVDPQRCLSDIAAAYAGLVDHLPRHGGAHALLIRPDGFVAWASNGGSASLREALDRWLR
jgi:2-polyprenyl-6-methoxyphenol hydroxylase-like FAD-dependent oxidoreductase